MRKQLLLLYIIVTILFGCKKEKHEVKYFPIPDTLKNAALFQKTSFWVYRNDTTGAVDCTYVKSDAQAGRDENKINDQLDCVIDYILMPLQSTLFCQFYLSGGFGDYPPSQPGYPFLARMIKYSNFCSPGKTAFALFDDTLTNHQGWNSYSCCPDPKYPCGDGDEFVELGEYSNFKVNDNVFERVMKTRSLFTFDYQKKDTIDFFFSPGYGLVKIIIRVDTGQYFTVKRATMSWSLLRYKTIQ